MMTFLKSISQFLFITSLLLFVGFGFTACEDDEVPLPDELIPTEITVEQLNSGQYEGLLVIIRDVQFVNPEGQVFNGTNSNANGNKTFEDCNGNSSVVFTATDKSFSNAPLPTGKGDLVGIASSFGTTIQLLLRNPDDYAGLNQERCSVSYQSITVEQFNTGNYEGQFVQIENVQFVSGDQGVAFNGTSSNANGSKTLTDCSGNEMIVFTSTSSSLSNELTPTGNGTIVGQADSFNGTPQLILSSTNDYASMTGSLCTVAPPTATLKTIQEVRDMFSGSDVNISDNIKIRGVVTSEKDNGSITSRNIYIQDASAAIVVRFNSDNTFDLDEEIEIIIKDGTLGEFNGLLQLEGISNSRATAVSSTINITPQVVSISDILTGNYEAQLVQLNNVSYSGANGTATFPSNSSVSVGDGSNSINMFVRSGFSALTSTVMPAGNVSIVVHASIFNSEQILPRLVSEVAP